MFGVLLYHIKTIAQGLCARDAPALLLAIYQVVTGSCVFINQAKQVTVSNKFICLIILLLKIKFAFVVVRY